MNNMGDYCSLETFLKEVDENREKYKYTNNWLFDPYNRLLCFNFDGRKYIVKRTTIEKGNLEVNNAKILYKYLDSVIINDKKIRIVIPEFISINNDYGYIVSLLYGCDFNQYYYNGENIYNKDDMRKIYIEVNEILDKNDLNYNGFIPRNLIVDDNNIYIIDFEDLNNKDKSIIKINQFISWSYIIDLDVDEVINDKNKNIELDIDLELKKIIDKYYDVYKLAIIAESSYKKNRKMDDIVNVISEYIIYEIELVLDIILYEYCVSNNLFDICEQLYLLVLKVKNMCLFMDSNLIKNTIYSDILNIINSLPTSNASNGLNETIDYAKRKILSLE